MRNELLKLLSQNARYTIEQLAVMLAADTQTVAAEIDALEKAGVICGYKTVIDWEKVDATSVSAIIELNVVVKGKNLQDIARFVARELATIDSVTSTATHFVMRRYKEMDVKLFGEETDDRGTYLL